jgi:RimJ/RimL family protein N-acetyltransferase
MDYWLTTERLALRRFTPDDLSWFADLHRDPAVTRYLGGAKDRAAIAAILRTRILDYYDRYPGLGVWVTVERVSGLPIGAHNLNHIQGEPLVQVGFTLAKRAWGRGYATEMAAALLRYGFGELSLPRISGIASLDNLPSQRVLRKIGLHRREDRAFPHPAYAAEGPMAWFERDAAPWLAERNPLS